MARSLPHRQRAPQRWTALLAALLLGLAGCATTDPEGADLVEVLPAANAVQVADAALRAGRYGEAIERYRAILREQPDDPQARLGLGEAYLKSGAHGEAVAVLSSLAGDPEIVAQPAWRDAARQGYGIALLKAGKLDEAHEVLEDAATADPTLWRAWNALALSFDRRGEWARARDSYEQALWAAPNPARIHNNLGMSLLGQGQHAAAADHFARALALDPGLRVARSNLRIALAFQDRWSEALGGVDDKELPEVLNNIGFVALMRGDDTRAEAYFLRAMEKSPTYYEPAWRNLQYLAARRQGS